MKNKLYTRATTVAQWYGNSVTIPAIKSPKFEPFTTSCMGIAATLLEKKISLGVRVALSNQVNTAYADPDKSLVVISRKFLRGDFSAIGHNKDLSGSKTIGAILGVIVHEIAHFAYSPKDLRYAVDYILDRTSKTRNPMLAKRVMNILEDIYIENRIAKVAPTLAWSLDEINRLMLTEEIYKSSINVLAKISPMPTSGDYNNILNFLLFAKITANHGKISPVAANLYKMARSVIRLDDVQSRYDLALKIYEIVAPELPKSEPEPDDQDDDSNHDQDDDSDDQSIDFGDDTRGSNESESESESDNDQDGDSDGESEDTTEQNNGSGDDEIDQDDDSDNQDDSNGSGDDFDDESEPDQDNDSEDNNGSGARTSDQDEILESESQATEPIEIEEIKTIDAYENRDAMTEPIYDLVEPDDTIRRVGLDGHKIIELTMQSDANTLEMDKRYTRLAQVAAQRTTVNKAYGAQHSRGRNFRQLHRIATDQKIFANPLATDTVKPMEIIILLDCSGSMIHWSNNKLLPASMATLGAATGLINGKCMVHVYAHTSDLTERQTRQSGIVNLYRLMSHGESIPTLAKRLSYLNRHAYTYACCNRDGYALYEISQKFQSNNRRRMVLVISDGQPSGDSGNYTGEYAMNHTKKIVDRMRQNGIEVYSLSIDSAAYAPNNYIYGKSNNVCNTDANAIDDMIRQLFLG